jgi:hypothetical protein
MYVVLYSIQLLPRRPNRRQGQGIGGQCHSFLTPFLIRDGAAGVNWLPLVMESKVFKSLFADVPPPPSSPFGLDDFERLVLAAFLMAALGIFIAFVYAARWLSRRRAEQSSVAHRKDHLPT